MPIPYSYHRGFTDAPPAGFEGGLRLTVQWYLDHQAWVEDATSGAYRDWIASNYADRVEVTA